MSFDPIESICVIPSDGFDEIWMVVNRANGRFVERMVQRIERYNCEDGQRSYLPEFALIADSGLVYGEDVISISSIDGYDTGTVNITAVAHGFSNGDTIRIDNLPEYRAIEGKSYTITNVTTNTFQLDVEV